MGTFNTLVIETSCENCNLLFNQRIQFRFGEVWQHNYEKGAEIKWGNPFYDIGKPGIAKVRAWGTSENNICPYCSYSNPENYDVMIENEIIIGVAPFSHADKYTEDINYNYFVDG